MAAKDEGERIKDEHGFLRARRLGMGV